MRRRARSGKLVRRVSIAIAAELDPDGIVVRQNNGVLAEQTVPHVHFHVIPRRQWTEWPPTTWIDVIPAEERRVLASRIANHL